MTDAPKTRKIAIVGTAEPHWRAAPFDDPSWEIWTCGGIFATAPRSDRHFELHSVGETCKGWGQTPEQEAAARNVYWSWIAQQGPKVVLRGSTAEAPEAQPYPLENVLNAFPDRYFTNSISWMMGLALLEGCTDIGLWGVDMALTGDPEIPASNEYSRQRPSVEFYIGIATGAGITVHLPPETTLMKARKLYAFDDGEDTWLAALDGKMAELKEKAEMARQQKLQFRHQQFEAEKMEVAMKTGLEIAGYARRNLEY